MIAEMCAECRNYFVRNSADIHYGNYVVENGEIQPLSFIKTGQFYRIVGSTFNDGVYQKGKDYAFHDEEFYGSVWAMYVPQDFVVLCAVIEKWVADHQAVLDSPFNAESFNGYSYQRATGKSGEALTWQLQFANKLNRYRRLYVV